MRILLISLLLGSLGASVHHHFYFRIDRFKDPCARCQAAKIICEHGAFEERVKCSNLAKANYVICYKAANKKEDQIDACLLQEKMDLAACWDDCRENQVLCEEKDEVCHTRCTKRKESIQRKKLHKKMNRSLAQQVL